MRISRGLNILTDTAIAAATHVITNTTMINIQTLFCIDAEQLNKKKNDGFSVVIDSLRVALLSTITVTGMWFRIGMVC